MKKRNIDPPLPLRAIKEAYDFSLSPPSLFFFFSHSLIIVIVTILIILKINSLK